ncbi:hypothetical protein [Nonomuraea sp. NPDC049646]|uniref:hypothetical protein n=1 Tax=unclassified Nonomuraea TaxID=2593643 RepID=UPI0037BA0707
MPFAQIGPVLQLAVRRRAKAWTPVLVVADVMVPFVDKDLMPLVAACLPVSFLAPARTSRLTDGPRPPYRLLRDQGRAAASGPGERGGRLPRKAWR